MIFVRIGSVGCTETHLRNVQTHFANRQDDLLILDICGGEAWDRLGPFLGSLVKKSPRGACSSRGKIKPRTLNLPCRQRSRSSLGALALAAMSLPCSEKSAALITWVNESPALAGGGREVVDEAEENFAGDLGGNRCECRRVVFGSGGG